jgi:hypothetical protein
MFGVDHFYHERVRKSVAIFGSIFNDAYIVRRSGNKVVSQMRVPIAYAPKRKFLERISDMYQSGNRDIENQTAIKLPRMSFEITNIQYDAQRQLPKTNYIKCRGDNPVDGAAHKIYSPVPYIITFELNIYGKQHDDCLQVVEQTLPYFSPQYSVSVKPLPGMSDIVEDVPIILQSTTFSDNYEGSLEDRRTIIYTLSFDMKINMWGPVCKTPRAVIENIDIDFFDDTLSGSSSYKGTGVNSDRYDRTNAPYYLETQRVEAQQPPEPFHPVNQDSDYNIVTDVLNEHSPDSDFENPTIPHPYE